MVKKLLAYLLSGNFQVEDDRLKFESNQIVAYHGQTFTANSLES